MADSSSSDVIPLLPEPGASAAHPNQTPGSSTSPFQPVVITEKELSKFKYCPDRFPDNKKYIIALLRTVCGKGDPLFQIGLQKEKNAYDHSVITLNVFYYSPDTVLQESKLTAFLTQWNALTTPPLVKNSAGISTERPWGGEKQFNRTIGALLKWIAPRTIFSIAEDPFNSPFHIDPNYQNDMSMVAEHLHGHLFEKKKDSTSVQFEWRRTWSVEGSDRKIITDPELIDIVITYDASIKEDRKKIKALLLKISPPSPSAQESGQGEESAPSSSSPLGSKAPSEQQKKYVISGPVRYTYPISISRLRTYLELHCGAALRPHKVHSKTQRDSAEIALSNTPKIFRLSSFFLKKMGTHKDHRQEKNVSVKAGCLDYIGTAFHATFDPFNERSPYEEITAWDLFVGLADIQKLAPGSAERKVAWFFYLLGGFVLSPTLNIVRFFTEFLMKAISNWLNCMTNELSVGLFAPCGTKDITIENRLVWGFFYLLLKPLQIVAETVRLLLRTMLSPINSFKAALEGNYYVGKLPVGWLLAGLSIVLSLSFWTALYFAIGPILLHMGFSFLAMSQPSALVNLGAGVVSVLTHLFGMVASPALMGTVAFGSIMGLITAGHGVRELLTHIASEALKPKNSYELFDHSKLDDDKRPFEREESLPNITLSTSFSH